MPLEMFEGQTGPRLIARLPVTDGSYALISTDQVPILAVFHPEGLVINGYPALSPVIDSNPELIAPMTARRKELRERLDTAHAKLSAVEAKLEEQVAQSPRRTLLTGLAKATLDLERCILDRAEPVIEKQITCTSIMVGRVLSFKLPPRMFEDVATIEVGTVLSIDIFNQ